MPRQRPEKKSEPTPPATSRVLPMQLQAGDRLNDETGEWEVIGRPYTTAGGKTAHVRVQRSVSRGEIRLDTRPRCESGHVQVSSPPKPGITTHAHRFRDACPRSRERTATRPRGC